MFAWLPAQHMKRLCDDVHLQFETKYCNTEGEECRPDFIQPCTGLRLCPLSEDRGLGWGIVLEFFSWGSVRFETWFPEKIFRAQDSSFGLYEP